MNFESKNNMRAVYLHQMRAKSLDGLNYLGTNLLPFAKLSFMRMIPNLSELVNWRL